MSSELVKLIKSIYPPSKYSQLRDKVYELISDYKRSRYVKVDDRVTVLFEDAATVWFQIEETVFLEGTDDESVIKEAIRTYSPMVPDKDELSLTIFIHIYNDDELRNLLPKYNGIERSVSLLVNNSEFKAIPIYPDDYGPNALPRSIHYLRVSGSGLDELLNSSNDVSIVIKHKLVDRSVKLTNEQLNNIRYSIKSIKWM